MGYAGKLEEKLLAQKLRRKGLSYREIKRHINVSKSTLSLWCRDIALTPKQALRLFKNRLKGAAKGRIIGAKIQQQRRLKQIQKLLREGRADIGKISQRDRFMAGIALYAAEGTKRDGRINFANSDPKLIRFMTSWFRGFCNAPNSKLRGKLWIHRNRDEKKARNFWSKLTRIPLNQFHKSYIAENKVNSRKIRKQIHEYGVFSIGFSDAKKHRKLMGWIAGITGS